MKSENPDHNQRQPGEKKGVANQRSEGHPGIGFFPFVPGCDFSQKNTGERRKKDRRGKQKDGIWEPVQNNREHRHAVMKRNSEISGKEIF